MSGIDSLPPLREVIAAHGLSARKSLGQNFLLDLNLTARIARAAGDIAGADVLEIGPMRSFPVIRDLATDMTPFFEKWQAAQGRATGSLTRADDTQRIDPASPRRKAADAAIECINCGVCYAACDVVASDTDYLGPAALNRSWTLMNDDREADRKGVLDAAMAGGGCHSCHSHGSCTEHCPVGLNPSQGVAGLKRMSLLALIGGDV